MKIQLAEVHDNKDFLEEGVFFAKNEQSTNAFKVYYVSPYYAGLNGGFIALPEIGSRILVCQPDNDPNWYFLGSTLNFGLAGGMSDPASLSKEKGVYPDKKITKATGNPQRYVFISPKGNALILSDEHNPNYFNISAELRSGAGKALKLIDSPLIDCIILGNEHGDRIKISTGGNDSTAPRSIEIETKGPVDIISKNSSINMKVIDGREINIINSSTGSKRSGASDSTPGNINIVSENNDINVKVQGDSSAIFLEAEGDNGHIILKSKGKVTIDGDKGVDITSAGNIVQKGSQIYLN